MDPHMTSRPEVSAPSRVAESAVATFGASLFENSPVWRSIERQQRMFDQVSKGHVALATAAFGSQAKRLSEMVASPAFSQVADLMAKPAFTLATEQLANVVRPSLEELSTHHRRVGQLLSASALANLETLNQRLSENLFNTRILTDEAFMRLAATTQLKTHRGPDLEGAFEEVFRRLPKLDFESEVEDGVPDRVLPTPAHVDRWRLLTPGERVFFVRACWVVFIAAQELTPEGRMLLDEFAVILSVITAIVFAYRPQS